MRFKVASTHAYFCSVSSLSLLFYILEPAKPGSLCQFQVSSCQLLNDKYFWGLVYKYPVWIGKKKCLPPKQRVFLQLWSLSQNQLLQTRLTLNSRRSACLSSAGIKGIRCYNPAKKCIFVGIICDSSGYSASTYFNWVTDEILIINCTIIFALPS